MKKTTYFIAVLLSVVLFASGCNSEELIRTFTEERTSSAVVQETEEIYSESLVISPDTETLPETEGTSASTEETSTVTESPTEIITELPTEITTQAPPKTIPVAEETTTPPPAVETSVTETSVAETSATETSVPATTAINETTYPLVLPYNEPVFKKKAPITQSYAYRNVSGSQKTHYTEILDAIKNKSESVNLSQPYPSVDELEDTVYAVVFYEDLYDYVDLEDCKVYFSDSSRSHVSNILFEYIYDDETIDRMIGETNAAADKIIAGITPEMSEYDVLEYFYATLAKSCVYDETSANSNLAYGALVEGKAVCQGYAKAFMLLCNKVGIENTIVMGDAGEPHMWNSVCIDGEWYELDLTWDDQSLEGYPDFVMFDHFLVTSASLGRTIYDYNIAYTAATGTKYNYYIRNGCYVTDEESGKNAIYNAAMRIKGDGVKFIQLKCDSEETLTVIDSFIRSGGVRDVIAKAEKNSGKRIGTGNLHYYSMQGKLWILIVIE